MVALSRCLASLALLAGADGARIDRKRGTPLPVLNYDQAYGGKSILSELDTEADQEWVVMVKQDTTDEQIQAMCKANRNGCNLVGSPAKGGVPFSEIRGSELDLKHIMSMATAFVVPDMTPELEADDVEAATWGLNRVGSDQRGRSGRGFLPSLSN